MCELSLLIWIIWLFRRRPKLIPFKEISDFFSRYFPLFIFTYVLLESVYTKVIASLYDVVIVLMPELALFKLLLLLKLVLHFLSEFLSVFIQRLLELVSGDSTRFTWKLFNLPLHKLQPLQVIFGRLCPFIKLLKTFPIFLSLLLFLKLHLQLLYLHCFVLIHKCRCFNPLVFIYHHWLPPTEMLIQLLNKNAFMQILFGS